MKASQTSHLLEFHAIFITVTIFVNSVAGDEAEPIPGTNLMTRTPYKIENKMFPGSVLTWTESTGGPDGYHYVQVDNTPDNLPNYSREGQWFTDALWEFIPVSSNSKWYRMVNRGQPKESLTWSLSEFVEGPGQTNYVVLDSNLKGMRSNHDFLVKPVRATGSSGEYYQLKFKGLPKAFFTYSFKVYGEKNQRYAMVDNSRDETIKKKFEEGGEWYDSTLFGFEMPV